LRLNNWSVRKTNQHHTKNASERRIILVNRLKAFSAQITLLHYHRENNQLNQDDYSWSIIFLWSAQLETQSFFSVLKHLEIAGRTNILRALNNVVALKRNAMSCFIKFFKWILFHGSLDKCMNILKHVTTNKELRIQSMVGKMY